MKDVNELLAPKEKKLIKKYKSQNPTEICSKQNLGSYDNVNNVTK